MWDFLLSVVIPVLAVFWMVVGGLVLLFVSATAIATRLFGVPVREQGTDKLADPKEMAKTDLINGGAGLAFFLMGSFLFWTEDHVLKGQFLIAACAMGGLAALISFWPVLRR